MHRWFAHCLALLTFSLLPISALSQTGTITLTFDGLGNSEPIDNYYNGGTGGFGSGPGPNYGITFTSDSLACISVLTAGGQCNFSNVPVPASDETAYFLTGAGDTMDVLAGFNTGFSFYYAATDYPGSVSVYSGLNGTGTLLATLNLPTNGSFCDGKTAYSCWSQIGVSFAGTARSVIFTGSANYIGFTDITIGLATVPSPPTPGLGSSANNGISGYSAEPVNTGNGNYIYQHADFSIPSRGLPLVFQRSYNTLDNYAGPLGANWVHTYNVVFSQHATASANVVWIRWGDGHGETYTSSGTGYIAQPGVYNALVQNPDGTFTLTQKNQTKYNFSASGTLTNIQDKNGNTEQLAYDGSGNLTMISSSGGRTLSLAYDANGRIVTVTDPMGRTENFAYDSANNLASATDPLGGVTTYTYDANHHVTQITLPNGNTLLQNAYDTQGRVVSQTNGRGFIWQFAYNTPSQGLTTITDARGAATVHTYDGSLRITGITDVTGATTSYTYDANNNRTSVTNQNGNTTTFAYDANGNLTGLTDPLSNVIGFTYDATNDLLTMTNPKSKTTNFSYDSDSNLTTIQDALGNKTVFAHDPSGELTSKIDARGNTTKFRHSSLGDLTSITDALGNTTNLGYDGDGRLVSLTDPSLHAATSAYDALGRLIQVSDALGNKTQFSYDAVGNLLSVTDANGHATRYSYDATNNLVSVTDALGHVTKYTYDADNNRVGFTNAKGNATSYQFDSLNRLTRSVDPLGFTTAYSYDAAGNVATVTDAKGQMNKFAYDALNHLLSIAYADQKNVAYAYDADGNRTSMIDWTGTTSYSYDALDRLTSVAFPGNKTVAYSYDANGRRASLTYPGGQSVSFNYDAGERLATVADWLHHATQYTYDPSGKLKRVQYPNSARIDFTYDPANRLTSVINTTVGVPPLVFNYTLDPAGNRTKVTEAGIPTVYGYDALNQLTSAQTWPLKTTWTYDAVGNRLSEVSPFGTTKYSYDASDRLVTAGTRTFAYDTDGNESSVIDTFAHTKRTFSFNAANRLVSVGGGLTSSFIYDGDGNRVSQSSGGITRNYVNDIAGGLPVVLQDAISGGPASSYVYGLNLMEAFQPLSNDFYQYDGLGSAILLTDSRGRAENAYAYDAWGNSILPAPPTNPFRFTGQALDPSTGLYYLRARYYDSSVGRFIGKDPLGSGNSYSYALNNPLLFIDPTGALSWQGLWTETETLATSTLQGFVGEAVKASVAGKVVTSNLLDNVAPEALSTISGIASSAGLSVETSLLEQGGQWLISGFGTNQLGNVPAIGWVTSIGAAALEGAGVLASAPAAGVAIGLDLLLQPAIANAPTIAPAVGQTCAVNSAGSACVEK